MDWGQIIEPILWLVGLSLLFPLLSYLIYQDSKTHWRKLAANNGLRYIRANWFKGGAFISGTFRGYQLKLESTGARIGNEQGYTQITLSANHSRLYVSELEHAKSITNIAKWLKVFRTKPYLRGQIKGELEGGEDPILIQYKQAGIETDVAYLQAVINLMGDIAEAYSLALSLEGRAVPYLRKVILSGNSQVRNIIAQLLDDILQMLLSRLEQNETHFVCQNCLAKYEVQKQGVYRYYGCRVCQQSETYVEVHKLVALLDTNPQKCAFSEQNGLYINWFDERRLIDFDEVGIISAGDKEVEQFAVQLGNDTDIGRKRTYQEARCIVSSACQLSENTMRILKQTFGEVEVKKLA